MIMKHFGGIKEYLLNHTKLSLEQYNYKKPSYKNIRYKDKFHYGDDI